jgi:ring-1,2-phenylacetyl-CoA epoxidase subunit PaaE
MKNHQFYPLTVKEVIRETPDAVSLVLDIPTQWAALFQYQHGQFITLCFDIEGQEQRRAYSFASSPVTGELPKVTIKRVKGGLVSNYINTRVKVGDTIDVMPPDGRFTPALDENKRKIYYLFAGGSGITPIISIAKTVLEVETKSNVVLLYGNANEESILFKKELDVLAQRYAGQFAIEHTLEQPTTEKETGILAMFRKPKITWTGWTGLVDAAKIKKLLAEHPTHGIDSEYYICGPKPMMDVVKNTLQQVGVPVGLIHLEVFASPSDSPSTPTTADSSVAGTSSNSDDSIVTVHLHQQSYTVSVRKNQRILDVLLKNSVDAPYSCKSGACSTCMAKVLQGSVQMDACFALDDTDVQKGYILACQSKPLTDTVELTFDID